MLKNHFLSGASIKVGKKSIFEAMLENPKILNNPVTHAILNAMTVQRLKAGRPGGWKTAIA